MAGTGPPPRMAVNSVFCSVLPLFCSMFGVCSFSNVRSFVFASGQRKIVFFLWVATRKQFSFCGWHPTILVTWSSSVQPEGFPGGADAPPGPPGEWLIDGCYKATGQRKIVLFLQGAKGKESSFCHGPMENSFLFAKRPEVKFLGGL